MPEIELTRNGGVATLLLNRAERRNALSSAMMGEIARLITEIDRDADTRVLTLTGAGRVFCSGLELGLHCDVRLAVPAARFGMPVAKIGIVVPYPLLLKLVDLVGPATTSELVFTGEPMTADRAHALAMVNRLVAPENLLAEATRMAETIASNAPLAVRAMKRAILAGRAHRRWEPPEDVLRAFEGARSSEDAREGIRAILEKRRPDFRGR